ncbi:elongation factor G [Desulfomonile tiedjei]|uniref:Elongation factor G n=1 Tax=Desulfomonile tiedjei (strain ATCC 49306 / DSM 6799 / DCB-1) TaxID=706587 RepID=I4C9I0_DESTA|nr:elongation factor G [Desulfomonile tiedjei]AFM26221.1 translation elongation factor 2 (EF-2/EF-G) [Desulfomonile tiedjei DSM 6799]
MKHYKTEDVRNVAVVSHAGSGKTTLCEAMLFDSGAVDRVGKVTDGSSNFDFEPEEVKRGLTINSSLFTIEWKKKKINIIDTPGDPNFSAEVLSALQAVDLALLAVDAVDSIKPLTEKVWSAIEAKGAPRLLAITKMDRERADFEKVLTDVKEILQVKPLVLQIPIGKEANFKGVVDLLSMKALIFDGDGRNVNRADIPGDLKEEADTRREVLIEDLAEVDDALMERYLEGEELGADELANALRQGILNKVFMPVLLSSGLMNKGIQPILDILSDACPSPAEMPAITGRALNGDEAVRKPSPDEPFSAYVFKTLADPYAGRLSLFRIYSGKLAPDGNFYNSNRETRERFGQLLAIQGKHQKSLDSAQAGDIVAVAKLKETLSGDTLTEEKSPIIISAAPMPQAVISFAIEPKAKGDEEKIMQSLTRLSEEDPTLTISRDPQTNEFLISGMGQVHIEVTVEKLKRKFGVDVNLKTPKVPYMETIKGKSKVEGKLKKQTGGRGQFAVAWLELEPLSRGTGFEFVDKIVGGVIPRQYIPAVEKGVSEAMVSGSLAGYPVVDVRVTVFDGKYHDVDSSEQAFKIAASKGFKKGMLDAMPVLLEPIMNLEVIVPEDCMGDVMGDLNSRRGRIMGMDSKGGSQVVKAQVPMAEVLKYASDLTSMTSGRGIFSVEFSHYEEVPANLAEKIIEASGKKAEEED